MKSKDPQTAVIKEISKTADGIAYVYRLIVNRSSRVASYNLPLYSIEVTMDSEAGHTEYCARELFSDVGRALVFLSYLAEHLVTPLNLPYVIEDAVCI